MTVCIAAICQPGGPDGAPMIFGASDRMLTAGDVEFEPPMSKLYRFFPWVVALRAGDSTVQAAVSRWTAARLNGDHPASVEEVANVYAEELANYRRRIFERELLSPIGLTLSDFIARQRDFETSFSYDVLTKFKDDRVDVATIIAGTDMFGPHIFVVHEPGISHCYDDVGFAAIGIGRRLAESQFMLARYHRHAPPHTALMLTYRAKKRAEVSPGVGNETDFFLIVNNTTDWIDEELKNQVHQLYQTTEDRISAIVNEEDTESGAMLLSFIARRTAAQQPQPPQPPPEQPDRPNG